MTTTNQRAVEELAACPFCGQAGHQFESRLAAWSSPTYLAGCDPCNLAFVGDTPSEAIAAWNRRTPGWRPISEAPRDGTDVIVGFDCATVWIVHVAWYRSGDEPYTDEPFEQGWWSYVRGSVSQELLDGHRTPTHWMPLPPAPGEG